MWTMVTAFDLSLCSGMNVLENQNIYDLIKLRLYLKDLLEKRGQHMLFKKTIIDMNKFKYSWRGEDIWFV